MRTKFDILSRLTKHGWVVEYTWKSDDRHLILWVRVFAPTKIEREYNQRHFEDISCVERSNLDLDAVLNHIELTVLNSIYDQMLDEQGTKVL